MRANPDVLGYHIMRASSSSGDSPEIRAGGVLAHHSSLLRAGVGAVGPVGLLGDQPEFAAAKEVGCCVFE